MLPCLATVVQAGAALAADQPIYAPPPAWVKSTPIPLQFSSANVPAVQMLLVANQSNFMASEDSNYTEIAYKITTPEGLGSAGTVSETWDPDTETIVIHRLQIIRGKNTTDVLANGQKFLVLRRENNLELAMLDGRLTATIELPGLEVGDVVDFAFTLERHDPALQGYSSGIDRLAYSGAAGRVFFSAEWPTSKPIHWRITDGLAAPVDLSTGEGHRLEIDMTNVEAPKPPVGAPSRYLEMGSIEFSQYANWAELSKLFAPLYGKASTLKGDSPLHAEIAKIAAENADPKIRATAALRLVEEQIRYVFLGMNDGGLVPADADVTWSRRFGDCKAKTAVLVALLRGLGIEADPVLVSTQMGDGMDQRLPTNGWFDHVIVRARLGAKTYWLDGTRGGDRSLDDLPVPGYRWGLPVTPEGAALVPLTPQAPLQPQSVQMLTIDASKGSDIPATAHVETVLRGDFAAMQRQVLASVSKDDLERRLRQFWTNSYPWLDVIKAEEFDDPVNDVVRLTADGSAKLDWTSESNVRFLRVPNTIMATEASFKRQPGPGREAPYAVVFPLYAKTTEQIVLPSEGDFNLVGPDIEQTAAGLAFHRSARIESHILTIEMMTRATEMEFPYSERDADSAALEALAKNGVAIIDRTGQVHFGPISASASDSDESAASRGDAAAQYRLGQMYAAGEGVPLDPEKAFNLFKRSADQGYARAETAVGGAYAAGHGGPPDYGQALTWYRKAADQGDPAAEVALAGLYWTGQGVAADKGQAFVWIRKAAEQGYAEAQDELASAYRTGHGQPLDYGQALVWYGKAADQGDALGQNLLGIMYQHGEGVARDDAKGLDWFRKSAAQNHTGAQFNIGEAYRNGLGVAQDFNEAMVWYRKAADQGLPAAYYEIGLLYENGQGVPKDDIQAADWFRKAAEQNFPLAEVALGSAYFNGRGVTKDEQQAVAWYQKGAQQEFPAAEYELGLTYLKGTGVAKDPTTAMDWLTKAASQGDVNAAQALGVIYFGGLNVPRDVDNARFWLGKAAALGDALAKRMLDQIPANGQIPAPQAAALDKLSLAAAQGAATAQLQLGELYSRGTGFPKDDSIAVTWFRKAADQGLAHAEFELALFYALGRGLPRDDAESVNWLRRAADAGDADAEALLADDLMKGSGIQRDDVQAAVWARKSANQGDVNGEVTLGIDYLEGRGVSQDDATAAVFLRKAADQNNATAESNVGFLYDYGRGVPQDFTKALLYFRKAADQGLANAELNVGMMYWQGRGVPKDDVEALKWFRKSAAQANAEAERLIGVAYLTGAGVAADKTQALQWFDKGSKDGDSIATVRAQTLRLSMSGPAATGPASVPAGSAGN